jgi:type II secretory pathway component PulJ
MRMSCPSYLHFAINAHSEVQFLEFRRLGRMMALLQIELEGWGFCRGDCESRRAPMEPKQGAMS